MAVNQAVVNSVDKAIAKFDKDRQKGKIIINSEVELYTDIVKQIIADKSLDQDTIDRLARKKDLSDGLFGSNPEEYSYIIERLAKRNPTTGYLSHISNVISSGQGHSDVSFYNPNEPVNVPDSFIEDLQKQKIKDFEVKEKFGKTGKFFDAFGGLGVGDPLQGYLKNFGKIGSIAKESKITEAVPRLVQMEKTSGNLASMVFKCQFAMLKTKASKAVSTIAKTASEGCEKIAKTASEGYAKVSNKVKQLWNSPKQTCLSSLNALKSSMSSTLRKAWGASNWSTKAIAATGLTSSALVSCTPNKKTESSGPVYPPLWMRQAVGIKSTFYMCSDGTLKSASSRATHLANFYKGLWDKAQQTGKSIYVKGAGNMTPKQLQQRYQEYSKLSSQLKSCMTVPPSLYKQCGIDRLRNASMGKLEKVINLCGSKIEQDTKLLETLGKKGSLTYNNKTTGKTESIFEIEVRLAQYKRLINDAYAEGTRRMVNQQNKELQQQQAQMTQLQMQQVASIPQPQSSQAQYSMQSMQPQQYNNDQQAYMAQQQMQQSSMMTQTQNVLNNTGITNDGGWGNSITNYFKDQKFDLGRLGTIFASAPDYLFRAFEGKTDNISLKNVLLPIVGFMAAGRFNGPLKWGMYMASLFGLFTAFNKENEVDLAKTTGISDSINKQPEKTYMQYTDEELNPRLSSPHITGNTLLMDIDSKPCTIAIPQTTADAYKQGALPLNTLANAILQKYDNDQKLASEAYEQQQTNSRGVERTRA